MSSVICPTSKTEVGHSPGQDFSNFAVGETQLASNGSMVSDRGSKPRAQWATSRWWAIVGLLLCTVGWPVHEAAAGPKTHTVYPGQRLGSIAKRYNVSVAALCTANRIRETEPIKPGQVLIIPDLDDKDGTRAAAAQSPRREPTPLPAPSGAPRQAIRHRVYPGHTLGKIAARYQVTVDALCAANGIEPSDPIKPGQVLVIPLPGRDDGQPSATPTPPAPPPPPAPEPKRAHNEPRTHVVAPGHTLGKIARRYQVTVAALCHANGLSLSRAIKPGDVLVIPAAGDEDGKEARQLRERGLVEATPKPSSSSKKVPRETRSTPRWQSYRKKPWKRGYVTLVGFNESWKGFVIDERGQVMGGARRAVSRVMGAQGDAPSANWRLVRLLAQVSDTFGGRPIRVVSGYRRESHSLNSRHRRSAAIDFSIPGVPNSALRDYLLTFDQVGVGYYPNSSFVHFDTRETKTYWVDYSGPGEAPRYASKGYSN